ncbi:hypothetical protein CSW25_06740 [Thermus scotoductus]|uniref:Glucodextranase-like C-terminal domain-containing protein n=4 Tax=Thermus TaxID=270 RepID=A0ABY0AI62_THESC|nr:MULTISPECIES: hypothetical protein [Thermus]ADW21737.1 hypothetical protein TSC_c11170 [Thermus scotoductus SA-01]RTH17638.1 hypothetical protein CSW39_06960 [Thermus scotoductus]RTH33726.1 hypothetical protein CSW35_04440 [Thermus scotoductus]RTI07194.1 hypothetical protein CSW25_06740 [Thermus scotoductus]RTI13701.1 hypothetical protein CSW24_06835 [Thermus scotoductus]
MLRRLWMVAATLVLALAQAQVQPPDPAQFGFPTVTASLIVQPWDYMRLGLGGLVLTVPSGAFGQDPVRLEILTGDPAYWQAYAPQGEKVVFAFALRVTDLKTGQRILRFAKPLHFSYYGPAITPDSHYLDVSLTSPPSVAPNPVKPNVEIFPLGPRHRNGRLSHPIVGAGVGWLVTSPATTSR